MSAVNHTGRHAYRAYQSEAAFQRAVVEYAELRGWRCYWTYDSRKSPVGYPDLTLVRDRVVWAELKRDGGSRPSPAQIEWISAIRDAGCEAYLWRPSQWEWIERTLR